MLINARLREERAGEKLKKKIASSITQRVFDQEQAYKQAKQNPYSNPNLDEQWDDKHKKSFLKMPGHE